MNTGKEDFESGRKHNPEKLTIPIFQFKISRSIFSSLLLKKIVRLKKLLNKISYSFLNNSQKKILWLQSIAVISFFSFF